MNLRSLHYLKAMGYNFSDEKINYNIKLQDFDNLKRSIEQCNLCHFSKTRHLSLIEKQPKDVKLMIVDALASKTENESGILLDSKKGKILQNHLYNVLKLSKEEFYYSYIFKCFSNGKFDDFSLQSCLPFFWNELKLIKPKIILCLGEYVFKSLGFSNFNSLRGEIFAYNDFFIMASLELEFIEKNPSYEKIFLNDLNKIKGFL